MKRLTGDQPTSTRPVTTDAHLTRPLISPLPEMPEVDAQEIWEFVQQAFRSTEPSEVLHPRSSKDC